MYCNQWLLVEFAKEKNLRLFVFVLFFIFNISSLRSETLTHTSALDFKAGTYSGNGISLAEDGSLKLAYSASGTLPEYHTGTGLPLKNFGIGNQGGNGIVFIGEPPQNTIS